MKIKSIAFHMTTYISSCFEVLILSLFVFASLDFNSIAKYPLPIHHESHKKQLELSSMSLQTRKHQTFFLAPT